MGGQVRVPRRPPPPRPSLRPGKPAGGRARCAVRAGRPQRAVGRLRSYADGGGAWTERRPGGGGRHPGPWPWPYRRRRTPHRTKEPVPARTLAEDPESPHAPGPARRAYEGEPPCSCCCRPPKERPPRGAGLPEAGVPVAAGARRGAGGGPGGAGRSAGGRGEGRRGARAERGAAGRGREERRAADRRDPAGRNCTRASCTTPLDLATLDADARRRAAKSLLVFSGLWGAVRISDRIPPYRCSMGVKLPASARSARTGVRPWKPSCPRPPRRRPRYPVVRLRGGVEAEG
ncbi:hypothetical protein SCYAM73S_01880 [Streptomyces cyaneofuscatus]